MKVRAILVCVALVVLGGCATRKSDRCNPGGLDKVMRQAAVARATMLLAEVGFMDQGQPSVNREHRP